MFSYKYCYQMTTINADTVSSISCRVRKSNMTTQIKWFFKNKLLLIFGVATFCFSLSTDAQSTDSYTLPNNTKPKNYTLTLTPNLEDNTYKGEVKISLMVLENSKNITLNMKDLDVKNVTISCSPNTNVTVLSTKYSSKTEMLQIFLADEMKADNNCELFITFEGQLNKSTGLYASKLRNGDRYMAAAFEPTSARAAFPNFDEPRFKSSFKIIINQPKSYLALSNMKRESNTTDQVTFSNTIPMPPYQLNMILCNYDSKKTEITNNGDGKKFDLISYAPKNQIKTAEYAHDIAKNSIKSIVNYFNFPYPSSELGMISFPNYKIEAPGQFGMLTLRDSSFSLNLDTASSNNLKTVALDVISAITRVWMGNVVTTDRWNNQWVYEGYAVGLAYKFLNDIKPNWTMLDQFPTRIMHSALKLDAAASSHPLIQDIKTLDQIATTSDGISRGKGASILRMMEAFMGVNNFADGTRDFVKKYKNGNAGTKDLLLCMEPYFKRNNSAVNATLLDIMDTWMCKPGFPVINVAKGDNDTYVLTQTPFLLTSTIVQSNSSWYIPLTYKTDKGVSERTYYFPKNVLSLTITPDGKPKWMKINNDQCGFYRVNYTEEMWNELIQAMTDMSKELTVTDRGNLINDVFAVGPATTALKLMTYLRNETEVVPWLSLDKPLSELRNRLMNTNASVNMKKYCRHLITPIYESIQWKKNDTTVMENSLRAIIMGLALDCGHPAAEKLARSEFDAYLNSTKYSIDRSIRAYVLSFGMKTASQEVWDIIYKRYLNETDPQEKFKLIAALAAPKDPKILQRCLELSLDPKNMQDQEASESLIHLSANPAGTDLMWNYTRANWTDLVNRFDMMSLSDIMLSIADHFNTESRLKEVKEFFTKYPDAGLSEPLRASVLEKAEFNAKWRNKNLNDVSDWLENEVKNENL